MKQSTQALKFVLCVGLQDVVSSYIHFFFAFSTLIGKKHFLEMCDQIERMLAFCYGCNLKN